MFDHLYEHSRLLHARQRNGQNNGGGGENVFSGISDLTSSQSGSFESSTIESESQVPSSTPPPSTSQESTLTPVAPTSTLSSATAPSSSALPSSNVLSTSSARSSTLVESTSSERERSTTPTAASSTITSASSSSVPSSSVNRSSSRSTATSRTSLVVGALETSSTSRSPSQTNASIGPGSTVTASDTPVAQSSNLNTSAMVGGIAAALIAVALLGFLICFFVRRNRKHKRAEQFNAAQFRRSAMVMGDDDFAAPATVNNPPASPIVPQMYQRGHGNGLSVSSNAGVAGQGAYFNANPQPVAYVQPITAYTDHPYASATSPPTRAQPIQERPQYTFGQVPDQPSVNYTQNVVSDDGHSAYSAEPQIQNPFIAEDYSGYHAYSPEPLHQYGGNYAGAHARTKSAHTVADDAYGGM